VGGVAELALPAALVKRLVAVTVVVLALAAAAAQGTTRTLQHVTVIGDSVADGMGGDAAAVRILSQEIDLDLELAPCRRVDGIGCPVDGVRPPSVVDVAHTLGSKLGPNVVVAVGYNDFEDQYARNIETALDAFRAAGVKHVWWLTLRAVRHPYLTMNDDIENAAKQHSELSVIDWNVYARSHPDWFQSDGLHLVGHGSEAMATLIHRTLLDAGVALHPVALATSSLPSARRGVPYHVRLRANAGEPPYRFTLLAAAPRGLHLLPNGTVTGRPIAAPGRYLLRVQVKDADGVLATRSLSLRITR
jgi:hypothetical protein